MVRVVSPNPRVLLEDIEQAIAENKITTWEESSRGSFTHATEQWRNKAWFRPTIDAEGVVFNIIRPKGGKVSRDAYAIYHGHFASMLLTHFDNKLKIIELTALAAHGDLV